MPPPSTKRQRGKNVVSTMVNNGSGRANTSKDKDMENCGNNNGNTSAPTTGASRHTLKLPHTPTIRVNPVRHPEV